VLPFSTGVIMEPLPVDRLIAGLPQAIGRLQSAHWLEAAEAIMTTDTQPKAASRRLDVAGRTITVTGIAKGAGMIRPNMATMLGFVATDAAVAPALMAALTKTAADRSFNRITIDGDTSTNDSFVVIATGRNGSPRIESASDPAYRAVAGAIEDVALQLAQAIVRDGEGATKFIEVRVEQARSEEEAARIAYAVAHSPLVKTAFFGCDPNWGRIMAAAGDADVPIRPERVEIVLQGEILVRAGVEVPFSEPHLKRLMDKKEVELLVDLHDGGASYDLYTTDLTFDYIKINASYRT
jgi:glutamate N-acetyltransferase/amino-acid N-acetyltransferase